MTGSAKGGHAASTSGNYLWATTRSTKRLTIEPLATFASYRHTPQARLIVYRCSGLLPRLRILEKCSVAALIPAEAGEGWSPALSTSNLTPSALGATKDQRSRLALVLGLGLRRNCCRRLTNKSLRFHLWLSSLHGRHLGRLGTFLMRCAGTDCTRGSRFRFPLRHCNQHVADIILDTAPVTRGARQLVIMTVGLR